MRNDEILQMISAAVFPAKGEDFFRNLVETLANAVEADIAYVGEIAGADGASLRTLAAFSDGAISDNFEQPISGTPCEQVAVKGLLFCPEKVWEQFPLDRRLTRLRIESYAGVPLIGVGGRTLGIMALMSRQKMKNTSQVESLLKIFAGCASAELERRLAEVSIRDITERKRAEENLLREKQFSDLAIDSVPGVFFLIDPDGTLRRWNRYLAEVTGFGAGEIERMRASDFFALEDRGNFESSLEEAFSEGEAGIEADLQCSNGQRIPYLFTSRRISLDGRPCLVGVGLDISERKEAEQERQKLEHRLRQAQKMETIGQLAGGVAHDFNNLLSPIRGYAELMLARMPHGDPLYHGVEVIKNAANRAANLTRQLLSFSRKQMLELKTVNLNQILAEFEGILRTTVREDIDFRKKLGSPLGNVKGDTSQIEQILLNLAMNAQDAMPKGGCITIETANVRPDESYRNVYPFIQEGPYVLLSMHDTGEGMGEETIKHIFEPFYTTKEAGKGTGLGLATVYGIVKQHNGYIVVKSSPGAGTTFMVFLPTVAEPADAAAAHASAGAAISGTETIVVVEDNELVRTLARDILNANGYKVIEFPGGEECLRTLESRKPRIDLLLTDVVMPRMNGKELHAKLSEVYQGLKVLYMSGYTRDVISHHGVLEGGVNFIQKPFSVEGLSSKVRAILESSA